MRRSGISYERQLSVRFPGTILERPMTAAHHPALRGGCIRQKPRNLPARSWICDAPGEAIDPGCVARSLVWRISSKTPSVLKPRFLCPRAKRRWLRKVKRRSRLAFTSASGEFWARGAGGNLVSIADFCSPLSRGWGRRRPERPTPFTTPASAFTFIWIATTHQWEHSLRQIPSAVILIIGTMALAAPSRGEIGAAFPRIITRIRPIM